MERSWTTNLWQSLCFLSIGFLIGLWHWSHARRVGAEEPFTKTQHSRRLQALHQELADLKLDPSRIALERREVARAIFEHMHDKVRFGKSSNYPLLIPSLKRLFAAELAVVATKEERQRVLKTHWLLTRKQEWICELRSEVFRFELAELHLYRCERMDIEIKLAGTLPPRQATSPLDRLDPTKLAAEDRPPGSPKELVALLPGHTRAVSSLAFSPSGDILASASWDNTIRLWRFGKETPTAWATLQGSASNLAMAPDGKVLAAGSAGTSVQLWSLTHDQPKIVETLAGHKHRPFSLAFAPSGKMFVSGCNDPVLRLWKLGEGEPEAWGVLANENVPSLGISALSFSKDSKLLAAGGFAGEKTLRLWNVAGNFLEEIELPKTKARLVAFSPTENLLAFAGDEAIQLWDVAKAPPRPVRTFSSQAKKSPVQALAFSRDGRRLLSAGQDKRVVLWDVAGGKRREWQFEDEMRAVAFAPDGRHLALGSADGFVFVLRVGQQP